MKATSNRWLTSVFSLALAWTLHPWAARPQAPSEAELNVVHYRAPEFPVAGPELASDESAFPSSPQHM